MINGGLRSVNAANAKAGIILLLGCVLALTGDTRAAQPERPVPDSKSSASVKGMKLKVSPNGRYFVNQDGKPFF